MRLRMVQEVECELERTTVEVTGDIVPLDGKPSALDAELIRAMVVALSVATAEVKAEQERKRSVLTA